jgi:hypothetical protein
MAYRFAGLYPVAGGRAEYEPPADAVVSLRMADGGETSLPLQRVQARRVLAAVPWRKARSARGQAHYPGYFWSATMGAYVIYESRLELARLLLADFDRDVTAIAAQPFLMQACVGGRVKLIEDHGWRYETRTGERRSTARAVVPTFCAAEVIGRLSGS